MPEEPPMAWQREMPQEPMMELGWRLLDMFRMKMDTLPNGQDKGWQF